MACRSIQVGCSASTPAVAQWRSRPARVQPVVSCSATSSGHEDTSMPRRVLAGMMAIASAAALTTVPMSAHAVSGGGGVSESLAGKDLSGQDLRKFKFTKANLRRANLSNTNLEGVSLFGSLSEFANFSGANMRNADLESGNYEGADFSNAILEGAFMNNAQLKSVNITGSDWTEVVLRKDVQKQLCSIADGVNPVTGVATRDSLLC